jgi:hypothetical protein
MFDQAPSPVIRAPYQATIRIGGEQGGAAVLYCLLAGSWARGLFWEHIR